MPHLTCSCRKPQLQSISTAIPRYHTPCPAPAQPSSLTCPLKRRSHWRGANAPWAAARRCSAGRVRGEPVPQLPRPPAPGAVLTVGKRRTGRVGGGLVGSTATKLRWARSGESRNPEELRYPSVSQSAAEECWHEAKPVPSWAVGLGEADRAPTPPAPGPLCPPSYFPLLPTHRWLRSSWCAGR